MTYVDDELARFHAAFDPQPEADPWAGWRAVAVIAAVCAVALAVVGLALSGPGDMRVAGASGQSFDEWYAASPENRFHYWYSSDERNASYFHLRQHFGTGALGDRAIQIAQCESGLDPQAVSPTNDHGLMQLNAPSWARRFEQVTGQAWNPNVYHAEANARFARWLHDETGGFSHWTCAR